MELEAIPIELEKLFSEAEKRIMEDVVERIRINGFAGATARWELTRLQQLGESEETLRQTMKDLLQASDKQLDLIFSEAVYEAYYTHKPAYSLMGMQQIPYEQNTALQQLVEATKVQTHGQLENITQTTGFAVRSKGSTQITYVGTQEFYKNTLDAAMIDIHSGAFSYEQVLNRTIKTMTDSGLRYIQYESGRSFRIDSAARMAVSTGFRQVQGHINEEAARQLGTNYYEVPWHAGARPTHQAWQGKVYSYDDLVRVCGLGSVTGLCGANCYHSYLPFIPGVSVRTYTDKWLEEQNTKENTPKEYGGKEYTTYQALQMQRRMERNMRASRESIELLKKGEADEETLTSARANYKAQQQQYRDFSKEMGLPEQLNRVFQDQRGDVMKDKKIEYDGIPHSWVQGMKMSDEDAIKWANPNYNFNIPPNANIRDYPYNSNCANSVVAAEMRFRGYDVIARGRKENRSLQWEPFTAWVDPEIHKATGGLEEIRKFAASLPDMSRVEVVIEYPDESAIPNHVILALKKDTKAIFYDPQNGGILSSDYMKTTKKAKEISYCRLDQLEVGDRGVTACRRAGE